MVPDKKLERVEDLLEELLGRSKETVKVRRLAKIVGMISSFSLAMGNVCCFYMRGITS